MGLFDSNNKKKKRDDFDSPVERIDLSTGTADVTDADDDASADDAGAAAPAKVPAAASRDEEAAPASRDDYGIEEAIALMRTLPAENVELVVRVVKHTLESTRIDIKSIIEDASAKQERVERRIAVLRDEITDLENEIETRRTEIGELEADHKETTEVKERLLLAEKLGKGDAAAPRAIPSAASGPLGKVNEGSRRSRSPSTSPPPAPGSAGSKTTIVPKK